MANVDDVYSHSWPVDLKTAIDVYYIQCSSKPKDGSKFMHAVMVLGPLVTLTFKEYYFESIPLYLPIAVTVALTNSLGSWIDSERTDTDSALTLESTKFSTTLLMYEGTSTLCP